VRSVVLHQVTKRYGRTEAVRSLDLTCPAGEVTVLLGHSGAGKTTILRVIAGLETVEVGEVVIGDTLVNELAPRDRHVSMAFESYALYPELTVFDNIAFPLRIARAGGRPTPGELDRRVREVAGLLEIAPLLTRRPRELSGGQRQRVALGRALVREAGAHLLDEPIAHLDAKLRYQLLATLKHFQKSRGMTTLWTTPDQLEAMAVADRLAILRDGAIEQIGPPEEVYRRPRNQFVAGLLGEPSMNFVAARIRPGGVSFTLEASGLALPVAAGLEGVLARLGGEGAVCLGLRPSDLDLRPSPAGGTGLAAEVLLYEPFGRYGVATVRALGVDLKVKTAGGTEYRPGTTLSLVLDPRRYRFFHPETGETLAP
jgi:ABC-type sugar transport system ATPase subunit